ncbi:mucin-2-like [Bacillus rossius redtenbacheri]|uniref:mucin-2-like n=1 Tax=Bacillus rossius redtenbacheri TaxID=93214 RepID=UPI002FDDC156
MQELAIAGSMATRRWACGGVLAGAILLLTARRSAAAPVFEHDVPHTQVGEYYLPPDTNGCYYNFEHYNEGDRITTNEPCLNCTCHNRMLMCYLRVCPFSKAIGQDCTIEKKPDQCCPIITCPEVPVEIVTSSTTTVAPTTALGPHRAHYTNCSKALGHLDNYGCTIEGTFYTDGTQVPGNPSKPCELCYCIRNRTACVMQECTLHVEGCTPVYEEGVCCPVRYDCNCEETPALLPTEPPPTTYRPTTPGLVFSTTPGPLDCKHDGETVADGTRITTEEPCEHCYCMRGDIVCAVQECGKPLEKEGRNCTALPPAPGRCCPEQYQCESDKPESSKERQNRKHENENGTLPFDILSQQGENATTVNPLHESKLTTKQHTLTPEQNMATENIKLQHETMTHGPITSTTNEYMLPHSSKGEKEILTTTGQITEGIEMSPTTIRHDVTSGAVPILHEQTSENVFQTLETIIPETENVMETKKQEYFPVTEPISQGYSTEKFNTGIPFITKQPELEYNTEYISEKQNGKTKSPSNENNKETTIGTTSTEPHGQTTNKYLEAENTEAPVITHTFAVEHSTKQENEEEKPVRTTVPTQEYITTPATISTSSSEEGIIKEQTTEIKPEEVTVPTEQEKEYGTESTKLEVPEITQKPEIEHNTQYQEEEKPAGTTVPIQEHITTPAKISTSSSEKGIIKEQTTEIKPQEVTAPSEKEKEYGTESSKLEEPEITPLPEIEHSTLYKEEERPVGTTVPTQEYITTPAKISTSSSEEGIIKEQTTKIKPEEVTAPTEQEKEYGTESSKLEEPEITQKPEIEHNTKSQEEEKPARTTVPTQEYITTPATISTSSSEEGIIKEQTTEIKNEEVTAPTEQEKEYGTESSKLEVPKITQKPEIEHKTQYQEEEKPAGTTVSIQEHITTPGKISTSSSEEAIIKEQTTEIKPEEVTAPSEKEKEYGTESSKLEEPEITQLPEIEHSTLYKDEERPVGTTVPTQEYITTPAKISTSSSEEGIIEEQSTEIKPEEVTAPTEQEKEYGTTEALKHGSSGTTQQPEIEHITQYKEEETPVGTTVSTQEYITTPAKIFTSSSEEGIIKEQTTEIKPEEVTVPSEKEKEYGTESSKLEVPEITQKPEIEHNTQYQEEEKPAGTTVPTHEYITTPAKISTASSEEGIIKEQTTEIKPEEVTAPNEQEKEYGTESSKLEEPEITQQPEIELSTQYKEEERPVGTTVPTQEYITTTAKSSTSSSEEGIIKEITTEIKPEEVTAPSEKEKEYGTESSKLEKPEITQHEIEHITPYKEEERPVGTTVPTQEYITTTAKISTTSSQEGNIKEQSTEIKPEEVTAPTEQEKEYGTTEAPKLGSSGTTQQPEIEHITQYKEEETPVGTTVSTQEYITIPAKISTSSIEEGIIKEITTEIKPEEVTAPSEKEKEYGTESSKLEEPEITQLPEVEHSTLYKEEERPVGTTLPTQEYITTPAKISTSSLEEGIIKEQTTEIKPEEVTAPSEKEKEYGTESSKLEEPVITQLPEIEHSTLYKEEERPVGTTVPTQEYITTHEITQKPKIEYNTQYQEEEKPAGTTVPTHEYITTPVKISTASSEEGIIKEQTTEIKPEEVTAPSEKEKEYGTESSKLEEPEITQLPEIEHSTLYKEEERPVGSTLPTQEYITTPVKISTSSLEEGIIKEQTTEIKPEEVTAPSEKEKEYGTESSKLEEPVITQLPEIEHSTLYKEEERPVGTTVPTQEYITTHEITQKPEIEHNTQYQEEEKPAGTTVPTHEYITTPAKISTASSEEGIIKEQTTEIKPEEVTAPSEKEKAYGTESSKLEEPVITQLPEIEHSTLYKEEERPVGTTVPTQEYITTHVITQKPEIEHNTQYQEEEKPAGTTVPTNEYITTPAKISTASSEEGIIKEITTEIKPQEVTAPSEKEKEYGTESSKLEEPEITQLPEIEHSTLYKEEERPVGTTVPTKEYITTPVKISTSSSEEGIIKEQTTEIKPEEVTAPTEQEKEYGTESSKLEVPEITPKPEIEHNTQYREEENSAGTTVPIQEYITTPAKISTSSSEEGIIKEQTTEIKPEKVPAPTEQEKEYGTETSKLEVPETTLKPEIEYSTQIVKDETPSDEEQFTNTKRPEAMATEPLMAEAPETTTLPGYFYPHPPQSSNFPPGPLGIVPTTVQPEQGIVPGEGNCLLEGTTYKNNSAIPPANVCHESCRCVSSIIQCEHITCPPLPHNFTNCVPVQRPNECCPTYICDEKNKIELEMENQVMEKVTTTQTPFPEKPQGAEEGTKKILSSTTTEHLENKKSEHMTTLSEIQTQAPGVSQTITSELPKAAEGPGATTSKVVEHITEAGVQKITSASTEAQAPGAYPTDVSGVSKEEGPGATTSKVQEEYTETIRPEETPSTNEAQQHGVTLPEGAQTPMTAQIETSESPKAEDRPGVTTSEGIEHITEAGVPKVTSASTQAQAPGAYSTEVSGVPKEEGPGATTSKVQEENTELIRPEVTPSSIEAQEPGVKLPEGAQTPKTTQIETSESPKAEERPGATTSEGIEHITEAGAPKVTSASTEAQATGAYPTEVSGVPNVEGPGTTTSKVEEESTEKIRPAVTTSSNEAQETGVKLPEGAQTPMTAQIETSESPKAEERPSVTTSDGIEHITEAGVPKVTSASTEAQAPGAYPTEVSGVSKEEGPGATTSKVQEEYTETIRPEETPSTNEAQQHGVTLPEGSQTPMTAQIETSESPKAEERPSATTSEGIEHKTQAGEPKVTSTSTEAQAPGAYPTEVSGVPKEEGPGATTFKVEEESTEIIRPEVTPSSNEAQEHGITLPEGAHTPVTTQIETSESPKAEERPVATTSEEIEHLTEAGSPKVTPASTEAQAPGAYPTEVSGLPKVEGPGATTSIVEEVNTELIRPEVTPSSIEAQEPGVTLPEGAQTPVTAQIETSESPKAEERPGVTTSEGIEHITEAGVPKVTSASTQAQAPGEYSTEVSGVPKEEGPVASTSKVEEGITEKIGPEVTPFSNEAQEPGVTLLEGAQTPVTAQIETSESPKAEERPGATTSEGIEHITEAGVPKVTSASTQAQAPGEYQTEVSGVPKVEGPGATTSKVEEENTEKIRPEVTPSSNEAQEPGVTLPEGAQTPKTAQIETSESPKEEERPGETTSEGIEHITEAGVPKITSASTSGEYSTEVSGVPKEEGPGASTSKVEEESTENIRPELTPSYNGAQEPGVTLPEGAQTPVTAQIETSESPKFEERPGATTFEGIEHITEAGVPKITSASTPGEYSTNVSGVPKEEGSGASTSKVEEEITEKIGPEVTPSSNEAQEPGVTLPEGAQTPMTAQIETSESPKAEERPGATTSEGIEHITEAGVPKEEGPGATTSKVEEEITETIRPEVTPATTGTKSPSVYPSEVSEIPKEEIPGATTSEGAEHITEVDLQPEISSATTEAQASGVLPTEISGIYTEGQKTSTTGHITEAVEPEVISALTEANAPSIISTVIPEISKEELKPGATILEGAEKVTEAFQPELTTGSTEAKAPGVIPTEIPEIPKEEMPVSTKIEGAEQVTEAIQPELTTGSTESQSPDVITTEVYKEKPGPATHEVSEQVSEAVTITEGNEHITEGVKQEGTSISTETQAPGELPTEIPGVPKEEERPGTTSERAENITETPGVSTEQRPIKLEATTAINEVEAETPVVFSTEATGVSKGETSETVPVEAEHTTEEAQAETSPALIKEEITPATSVSSQEPGESETEMPVFSTVEGVPAATNAPEYATEKEKLEQKPSEETPTNNLEITSVGPESVSHENFSVVTTPESAEYITVGVKTEEITVSTEAKAPGVIPTEIPEIPKEEVPVAPTTGATYTEEPEQVTQVSGFEVSSTEIKMEGVKGENEQTTEAGTVTQVHEYVTAPKVKETTTVGAQNETVYYETGATKEPSTTAAGYVTEKATSTMSVTKEQEYISEGGKTEVTPGESQTGAPAKETSGVTEIGEVTVGVQVTERQEQVTEAAKIPTPEHVTKGEVIETSITEGIEHITTIKEHSTESPKPEIQLTSARPELPQVPKNTTYVSTPPSAINVSSVEPGQEEQFPEQMPEQIHMQPLENITTSTPEFPTAGYNFTTSSPYFQPVVTQHTTEYIQAPYPDHESLVPPNNAYLPPSPSHGEEYEEDDEPTAFGPGTCRYAGKVYVSAQQIPRDDPCDFCFCFRGDIICLQQSCPPPIPNCREEPIEGFCCPRYECPVSMVTVMNTSTTTTTTTTTLPPHFFSHAYKGTARRTGCLVQGKGHRVGEVVESASGPCLLCRCGGDGRMQCEPQVCNPQPMLKQMILAAASRRR